MNMPRKSPGKLHSSEAPRCPINVAARRAGLTAHVIRAWERRYEAIVPERTSKGRRLYSEWEIQRLVLLRQAVDLGHRISEIADLPIEDLRVLVGQDAVPGVEASPRIPLTTNRLIELAMDMVQAGVSGTVAAIEEQTAVTREITGNMQTAAGAVKEIDEGLRDILEAAGTADKNVQEDRDAYALLMRA